VAADDRSGPESAWPGSPAGSDHGTSDSPSSSRLPEQSLPAGQSLPEQQSITEQPPDNATPYAALPADRPPELPTQEPAPRPAPPSAPAGYGQAGYGQPPSWPTQPGYGYPPGYLQPPGYTQPPGVGYPPGYGQPPGYGYPPGYVQPPGVGYAPPPGFGQAPVFGQPPGYPGQPGWPGYPGAYSPGSWSYQPGLVALPFLPAGPAPGLAWGGIGVRFGALVIDAILMIVTLVMAALLADAAGIRQYADGSSVYSPAANAIMWGWVVFFMAYHPVCWLVFGASAGQKTLGLRIVRASDGQSLGLGAVLIRFIIFAVCVGSVILGLIAAAMAADDPFKRAWHDEAARSVVVRRA
jgi:uncharacterized RDD family membrane protein YckC